METDAPFEIGAPQVDRRLIARRRQRVAALAVGALTIVGGSVAALTRQPPPPVPPATIEVDAWAPYWVLDEAESSLATMPVGLREVSPFWFSALGPTDIVVDGRLSAERLESFVAAARARGSRVIPSIVDAMDAGAMAAVLAEPGSRSAHVNTIRTLAASHGFDGIDLDYEKFAFADDRATWATTKPAWIAFVSELAAVLRTDGRTLTVSVPRPDEFWVYDYAAIEPHVDRIRVMAYDFSVDTPGPIAPIEWVREIVAASREVVADDSKLVLGVPLYGRNWPISTIGTCPADTPGKTSISQRDLPALIAERGAVPVHDPVTGEAWFEYSAVFQDATTSCTQVRRVHFVDAEGARLRVDLARTEGLGGASLWALGFDDPQLWTALTPITQTTPAN